MSQVSQARRSWLAIGGVLTAMLAVISTAGTAHAAEPANPHAGGVVFVMAQARQAKGQAIDAVSPTISPAARQVRHFSCCYLPCDTGNLCVLVWDPTTSDYKVFDLYFCRKYALANWFNDGYYFDAQTGGVRTYLYDRFSNVIASFTPDGTQHLVNWDQVWYIRNG